MSLLVKKIKRNDLLIVFFKENTSIRLGKTNFPPQQLNQLLVFDLEQEVWSQRRVSVSSAPLGGEAGL